MWDIEVTDAFEGWWETLTQQEQEDVTAYVELLQERGANLRYPYSSGIQGSKFSHLRELRIQSGGNPIRVFYAFDPRRVAILLIGGNKTGKEKQFYREYIRKAEALYEEHLNNLGD
ncbi:MAG: addiction module toxin RelE [Cyanobacteria bacterium]|jgi:hypothetical protein|nr:addiction module toxin RelE [Cyanobacteria bacterium GSL.Bin1]